MVSRAAICDASIARGSTEMFGVGMSVVPTMTCPCHGTAKSTRPSSVCGTISEASSATLALAASKVSHMAITMKASSTA